MHSIHNAYSALPTQHKIGCVLCVCIYVALCCVLCCGLCRQVLGLCGTNPHTHHTHNTTFVGRTLDVAGDLLDEGELLLDLLPPQRLQPLALLVALHLLLLLPLLLALSRLLARVVRAAQRGLDVARERRDLRRATVCRA